MLKMKLLCHVEILQNQETGTGMMDPHGYPLAKDPDVAA